MIVGLNLSNYSSLGHREAMTAIAERAEELGYSSLWAGDHILLPTSLPEPFHPAWAPKRNRSGQASC
jgi:alkanesulfonate monooxygenase SsuD/methylene tetrahydromethanopterin reductase-like flavin-dependent oxidoreductase (luciferase family)